MNEQTYRLIRGKLHRVTPTVSPGYQTIRAGVTFVPTDEELRIYGASLEGPLAASPSEGRLAGDTPVVLDSSGPAPATATVPAPTPATAAVPPAEQAANDLKMGENGLRSVIRQADANYLTILHELESQRKPTPRPRVMQMIERRLKVSA